MLVVATFCSGWVCKEQWDATLILTPLTSPAQVETLIEELTVMYDRQLKQVAKAQSELEATQDDIARRNRQQEIVAGTQVLDEMSTQVQRLERERHGTFFPRWFPGSVVRFSLVISAWVLSCMVAMRMGMRSNQAGTRPEQH
jgi:hypothetical protein